METQLNMCMEREDGNQLQEHHIKAVVRHQRWAACNPLKDLGHSPLTDLGRSPLTGQSTTSPVRFSILLAIWDLSPGNAIPKHQIEVSSTQSLAEITHHSFSTDRDVKSILIHDLVKAQVHGRHQIVKG